jgi:hypothetical protein
MHGGALDSGAPLGNSNAMKHGICTRETMDKRRRIQDVLRRARRFVREMG